MMNAKSVISVSRRSAVLPCDAQAAYRDGLPGLGPSLLSSRHEGGGHDSLGLRSGQNVLPFSGNLAMNITERVPTLAPGPDFRV
jgi:hypothetical protein